MAPVTKPKRPLRQTFLREWREHAGLDQEEAATELDISRTLLSKIENARSPYSQRILERAAEVYGCTPAELLARDPTNQDSLWALWERAEQTSGTKRKKLISLLEIGLEDG